MSLVTGHVVAALSAGGTLVFILVLYGGIVLPIRYTVASDHLVIRFGLIRSRVPYDKIQGVKPTRNPLSSPALSLNRLHLETGSSLGPNISPKDREGFLRALAARAPHLKREGDRLVPA
jgi:membrane protein YdbS with pleckstrin-like domain